MRTRTKAIAAIAAAAVVAAVAVVVVRDQRIRAGECAAVTTLADAVAEPIGDGTPITVVGDSYAQGWGLDDPRTSWVSDLPDSQVVVLAASGAGFTKPGLCDGGTIAELAARSDGPVIVQAGLNDVDADLDALADAVDEALDATDVQTLVGPPLAPALDADALAAVDAVLATAADEHDVDYVSTIAWDLPFSDGIHLTPEGHALFGEMVAAAR